MMFFACSRLEVVLLSLVVHEAKVRLSKVVTAAHGHHLSAQLLEGDVGLDVMTLALVACAINEHGVIRDGHLHTRRPRI